MFHVLRVVSINIAVSGIIDLHTMKMGCFGFPSSLMVVPIIIYISHAGNKIYWFLVIHDHFCQLIIFKAAIRIGINLSNSRINLGRRQGILRFIRDNFSKVITWLQWEIQPYLIKMVSTDITLRWGARHFIPVQQEMTIQRTAGTVFTTIQQAKIILLSG